jgi:hypothetical protein
LAIDIENRAKCEKKRPYYSLVTFSLWGEPNVRKNHLCNGCVTAVPVFDIIHLINEIARDITAGHWVW